MQKWKYNFYEWLHKTEQLPEDANEKPRRMAAPFKCDDLIEKIEKFQKGKLFGKIDVFDDLGGHIIRMDIEKGIVIDFELLDDSDRHKIRYPLRVLANQRHKNDVWSFRKQFNKGVSNEAA